MKDHEPFSNSLPDLLLSTGAMEGPYHRTRPVTVSLWHRVLRYVRVLLVERMKP